MILTNDRIVDNQGRGGLVLAATELYAWVLIDGADAPVTLATADLRLESLIPAAEPVTVG